MKPLEQMGELPEQKKGKLMENKEKKPENLERKITTPEEAAKMTRQRRKEYGLEENNNLTPEKAEEIETAIGELIDRLNKEYDYNSLDSRTQDDWIEKVQEAKAGKDRELAKIVLEKFINVLATNAPKTKLK